MKIYKTYGTLEQLDETKLAVGNLRADFVIAHDLVVGVILTEPSSIKNIRVLLLNGESPYRPEVYITSDQAFSVRRQDSESLESLNANDVFKASDFWQDGIGGFLELLPSGGRSFYLLNESHERVSLPYPGNFEIRKYEEGFGVVNDLSLETYLCHVVPSEMPASYELEALRAQAVCARSYASIQLATNVYAHLAANVDDTVRFQVYNKQPPAEKSSLAVADTVGEVVQYQGEIAETFYYSTSSGFSQEISLWNLPTDGRNGYLRSISLLTEGSGPDFANEEEFQAFIQSHEVRAFDSDIRFFRWRAELDLNGKREAVNAALAERKRVNEQNVQLFDQAGNPTTAELSTLGSIQGLEVVERMEGGGIARLRLHYEKGSVLLVTEFNIRRVLVEAVSSLVDKEGGSLTMNLLPSSIFTILPTETSHALYGGGYGHGIGLSQNGANGMAKAGFSYLDILKKFYHEIEIVNIYN
jgi:stage II sporulation protein D